MMMKKLEPAEKIAITELRAMLPFFLICDGVIALICISGIIFGFLGSSADYTLFTGLVFGNIASVLNFYLMAYAAGKLTMRGENKKPRRFIGLSYGVRIITLFAIYYALMTLGVINPVTAVIPLLYPSFHYKLKAIFNKSV